LIVLPSMNWQSAVERTVTGLGYDLVDLERSGGGLLRVFIDRLPGRSYPTGESTFVTVDDCEAVTRQLQYVLEVDNVDYARLEVSSPGLDRPLKKAADYERFAGEAIELTLKLPFQGRKKYRGRLQAREGGWRLLLDAEKPAAKAPARAAARARPAAAPAAAEQALDFVIDEVREARLVPVLNFKGRPAAEPRPQVGGQEQ
jgi:ribosome maturation factor RimP